MPAANKKNLLLERWNATVRDAGPRPAVLRPDGSVARTFEEIENEARELAKSLGHLVCGSVVALQVGNHLAWPALLIALFRRGLVPLPLGSHVEPGEIETLSGAIGIAATIGLENGRPILRDMKEEEAFPGDVADFLKLTSGTTAAPRAIQFRAEQLVADCDNVCATMGIGAGDVNYGVIPFSHSYGFSNLITPLICRGVPLVASHDRIPRAILDGLRASGATVFPGMPLFYQGVCGVMDEAPPAKLRLCISAGAPLPQRVGEEFTEKFGRKIHVFYGSSECGGISYDRSEAVGYEHGFVGHAMDGVSLNVTEDSRLEVRSEAVGEGYFPEPDPAVLGAGRFIPGDLVTCREEGLFLIGRATDVINVAGRKLHPSEVETGIAGIAGVRAVLVFGVPSKSRNEEPVACVVLRNGTAIENVRAECRRILSTWQMPRDFWVVQEIPVNERGKISRRELARRYLEKDR